jgi:hypothetical protein
MSVGTKLLQAAAGNAGGAVYVDDVFSTTLYTGTDGSVVVPTGLDLADKGGMIWGKSRSAAQNHRIYDSGRGTQYSLIPNATSAQSNQGTQTFGSSSVTLGAASGIVGSSSYGGPDYVLWAFAKQEKFFDIVTYTGNGTAGRTISHNLGSVPGMMIVKATSDVSEWVVYHRSLGNTKYLHLEQNHQAYTSSARWNDTTPTDTVFTVGTTPTNTNGTEYVAYLFAHDEQDFGEDSDEAIIKCDGYTGNGSTTGPIINLGFEPQWILIKRTSANGDWMLFDIMRGIPTGLNVAALFPNAADAETSTDTWLEVNPTGFQLKHDHGRVNANSATYVYVAIARSHKPASEFAATDLFGIDTLGSTGDGAEPGFRSTFPCDTGIRLDTSAASTELTSRLTQGRWIYTDQNSAEGTANFAQFDYSNGWGASTSTASNYYGYMFRRARGFFDVVAYTSNTTYPNTFNHNLGAVPELILIKRRDGSSAWAVYSSTTGNTKHLVLSSNAGESASSYWNNTTPTSTVVTVGGQDETWGYGGYTYIAYLFATVTGISKVGSYTGTGSDLNVDCGFSAGARFVLIKRTDSTGDWYLYDSSRGIVAGNDPYKLLNSNAAQVTGTDYIDPLSSGFTVTSSAPAGLNASSGTYIFLAIA